jgi:membrane-associated phospholipid phosphatase
MGTVAAVAISYQWVDRPIALLVHDHLRRPHHGVLDQLTHIPDPLIPLAVVTLVVLGLWALAGRPLSKYQATAFVCSLSVVLTETVKDQLKFIFGRTWPETWTQGNPSFIRDDVYGFHFMHGGGGYDSFPSGHMAAASAALCVLWLWYPRLWVPCLLAGFAVGAGLVGANYHFLSDVIAGGFLGISTGCMADAIWQVCMRGGSRRSAKCDGYERDEL